MARYSRSTQIHSTTDVLTCTQTSPAGRWLKYCTYPMTPWAPSPNRTSHPYRTAGRGAAENRSPITTATASAPMNQPMSACNWVTLSSAKWNRGTVLRCPLVSSTVPASGPVPVTTVPAASISAVTATSSPVSTRRSVLTSDRTGPSPSPSRT